MHRKFNPMRPDHDSTFRITKTPAPTTSPSATSLLTFCLKEAQHNSWYRCLSLLPSISPAEYRIICHFQALIQFSSGEIVPEKQSSLWKAEVC